MPSKQELIELLEEAHSAIVANGDSDMPLLSRIEDAIQDYMDEGDED